MEKNSQFIITLVVGDGIGPEMAAAFVRVFKAVEVRGGGSTS